MRDRDVFFELSVEHRGSLVAIGRRVIFTHVESVVEIADLYVRSA